MVELVFSRAMNYYCEIFIGEELTVVQRGLSPLTQWLISMMVITCVHHSLVSYLRLQCVILSLLLSTLGFSFVLMFLAG